MNKYIGHESQLWNVEESRLVGGRGDGMRILKVRNAIGLELEINLSRGCDISRVFYKGINLGFFSPCGYVGPSYFEKDGFARHFTAGFMTTCGLHNAGIPCTVDGEFHPLHGRFSYTPCETYNRETSDSEITINATLKDQVIFGDKLTVVRQIKCSKNEARFSIKDKIINETGSDVGIMLMYHCNTGYPLLCEESELIIPSVSVVPRDEEAAKGMDRRNIVESPVAGYQEQCFYHELHGNTRVGIRNRNLGIGLWIDYNADELPCFTQWKMMGVHDYVIGLEPGTCNPCGREVAKEKGLLKVVKRDDYFETGVEFTVEESK